MGPPGVGADAQPYRSGADRPGLAGGAVARRERDVLEYGAGMPESVRSIGAVAAFNHDGPDDPDFAVVDLRLFALTSAGEQIDDPQPVSLSVRCERAKLSALELSALMSLRLSRPPTGARLAAWERDLPAAGRAGNRDPPREAARDAVRRADTRRRAARRAAGGLADRALGIDSRMQRARPAYIGWPSGDRRRMCVACGRCPRSDVQSP